MLRRCADNNYNLQIDKYVHGSAADSDASERSEVIDLGDGASIMVMDSPLVRGPYNPKGPLEYNEWKFLLDMGGCIIRQYADGKVSVDYHVSQDSLDQAWMRLQNVHTHTR